MFAIFARFAHFILFSDRRITFADAMFHDAFFAYDDDSTVFFYVLVLLTVKALSKNAVLDESLAFLYLEDLHEILDEHSIRHFYDDHLHVKREIALFVSYDSRRS